MTVGVGQLVVIGSNRSARNQGFWRKSELQHAGVGQFFTGNFNKLVFIHC